MSDTVIGKTTEALKVLLEQEFRRSGQDDNQQKNVYIGAPIKDERGGAAVSLFLFHIEPNAELRNQSRFDAPVAGQLATRPAEQLDALPLDLRYMITVFREGNAEPNELITLGQVIQALHAQPTLTLPELSNQIVRLTPEAYPMEEMSRIWGLFPNEMYRTSIVYLATPVFVEVNDIAVGPPVLHRKQLAGILSDVPEEFEQQAGGL